MQCQGKSLRSHLIQPRATDKVTNSGIAHSIVFRLGVSSFPFALYYRAGELPSLTKGLVASSDGTQQQRKETERSAELSEGGWRIVEREKFAGYVRGQIKLKEEARRLRNSGQFASARRRSTNDNVGERRSTTRTGRRARTTTVETGNGGRFLLIFTILILNFQLWKLCSEAFQFPYITSSLARLFEQWISSWFAIRTGRLLQPLILKYQMQNSLP